MSQFQIHQDAEKENPRANLLRGEKSANILQPSAFGVMGKSAAGGVLLGKPIPQQQLQGRNNFATKNAVNQVNRNKNNNNNNNKKAFREVGNVKLAVKDENSLGGNIAVGVGVGVGGVGVGSVSGFPTKKSTVVPVVEQFKTFSVYEDQNDENLQQHVAGKTKPTDNVAVNKENVCTDTQRLVLGEREISVHDETAYGLDATPMSISDVLSPMSVDRSQITTSSSSKCSLSVDEGNLENVAERSEISLKSQQSLEEDDIKALPHNDRQRFFEVIQYQNDILDYFRESEKKHRPKPHYMRRQTDINNSMRTILVDWLVEVSEEYNLDTETLYLSISYIDRFLSQMSVVRSKLQLVGTAAMYIAAKYEEIYPPDVAEFVFITDDTYNKTQVLRMEQIILKILAFDICTPTALVFLNTYAVLINMPSKLKSFAQYISELSLLEADPFLRFLPSTISSAALAIARHHLGLTIWSNELEQITKYSIESLKEMVVCLSKAHCGMPAMQQQAIPEKYKNEKYKAVSTIKAIEITNDIFDELVRNYYESADCIENSLAKTNTTASTTSSSSENVRKIITVN